MLRLYDNKLVRKISRKLERAKIDEEEIAAQVYAEFSKGSIGGQALLHVAGKKHVRSTLESICEEQHGAEIIKDVNSDKYEFHFDDKGGAQVRDNKTDVIFRYDKIINAGGIVVGFETCLASRARERQFEIPRRIQNAMNLARVRQQVEPLKEIGDRQGYVLVVYSHQAKRPVIQQSRFVERGGVIASIGFDYGTFCSRMSEVLTTYGLTVARVKDFDSGEYQIE